MSTTERKDRRFGWKPEPPSIKDWAYKMKYAAGPLESVNLADNYKMPKIFNQKNLGSCVGNAISFMISFELMNKLTEYKSDIPVSRLMIYYMARELEDSVYCDAGCYIRDAIRSVVRFGVCPEKVWPYTISKFATKPSKKSFDSAVQNIPLAYRRLNNANKAELVDCLRSGNMFVFGFTCYSSLYGPDVERTGYIPYPSANESVIGGHAVGCTGYDAETNEFYGPNSWDDEWGVNGYWRMSADYVCNPQLADDFWTFENIR